MALDPKVELAIFAFVIASLYLLHTKVVTPIFAEWSIKEKLKKRYELTFERRDSLMYHIGHCQSNGEMHDAKTLLLELEEVDKELDLLENEVQRSFWMTIYDSFCTAPRKEVKHLL